ncbi:YcbK family protein [Vibrio renipiscarius]|uniref:Murein endopeptidase K n=1 Tax=Vibrio renipiscarius TaxID=1461322 RepID=A0A0C2NN09_9VIBR|nr:YcbK family protein [Vibrio renipiscarius]KII79490.1 lipoprotein [Vibrio renipiscarius]KII80881.1 lipoprotein [Vibrio renipiscarius]
MQVTRRNFFKLAGSGLVVASCAPSVALASYPDLSRSLAMSNVHTGEALETRYFDGRQYIPKELTRIDKICRDFRRNEMHKMDKHLFDQISLIQTELGVEAEVQIISGYRSPATNKALRSQSSGVAKKSYHMLGQAIDFRLDGVPLKKVRDIAREMKVGGVGYYPSSNFVHIDTGPARYWS